MDQPTTDTPPRRTLFTVGERPLSVPRRVSQQLSQTQITVLERAENVVSSRPPRAHIKPTDDIFDENDPKIKEDILRMIIQYLRDENYYLSMQTVIDESNMKTLEMQEQSQEARKFKRLLLEGDWQEIDRMLLSTPPSTSSAPNGAGPTSTPSQAQSSGPTPISAAGSLHVSASTSSANAQAKAAAASLVQTLQKNGQVFRAFQYALYKQQYLELIEAKEHQKAFSLLTKRLKPLESFQTTPSEFRNLCYLLTARSVHDVVTNAAIGGPAGGGGDGTLKEWEGVTMSSRDQLVERFQRMLDFGDNELKLIAGRDNPLPEVPDRRLVSMLRQAVAYQVEFSPYHPRRSPNVSSLLEDYASFVVPNSQKLVFEGHTNNVKCVAFAGEDDRWLLSGGGDNTVRIWDADTTECVGILEGHKSRVWDVASNADGTVAASGSGDGTVKLWNLRSLNFDCLTTLEASTADVYSLDFHPSGSYLVACGYDRTIRLHDVPTGKVVRAFTGHHLSVSRCVFNPLGNLLVSGSKDATVRFWDVVSGVCVKTLEGNLGEVTSVEMDAKGVNLLSGCKDNSNRLWDIRAGRPIRKFKGHQNTSKNFLRASFGGSNGSLIAGGSEDGALHLWDAASGEVLQRLRGHRGIVYRAAWSEKRGVAASCGEDGTVRTWCYDGKKFGGVDGGLGRE